MPAATRSTRSPRTARSRTSQSSPTGSCRSAPGETVPSSAHDRDLGPDGAFYVGQLTGFPFPLGAANVYRVPSRRRHAGDLRDGFTKIIDIAFAPDGSLYVLQISAQGGLRRLAAPGALIRVSPDGTTKTTIVAREPGWSRRAASQSRVTDRSTSRTFQSSPAAPART